jgi:hypothetical protein
MTATYTTDPSLDVYVAWREAEADVHAAYQRWDPREDRARFLEFTSYLAALDREEHAARCYARQVAHVGRLAGLRAGPRRQPADA